MFAILLLISAIAFFYYYGIKPYSYWAKKNVQTGKIIPIAGDNLPLLLGKESIADLTRIWYNKIQNVRYLGIYQLQVPTLIIKSPELIKQICIKDFDHFLNHRSFMPDGADEFWLRNLISLKGQTWKNMRSTLSPSFTSSKMKSMFDLISKNGELFVQHFLKKDEKLVEVELKDAFTRYTNDVIASCVFGIQVDSLGDRDNVFYLMGRKATNFTTPWMKIKFLLFGFVPKLMKLSGIGFFPRDIREFFTNIVKDTMKMRYEKNIKRSDMLGLLMEAREEIKKQNPVEEINEASFAAVDEHLETKDVERDLSDLGITAQVFIFFLGGFESVSTAMCFMAYELAINPDVQNKLIEEIDANRTDNAPTYETISKMTYLDMVVSESLRMWPVAPGTDRVVTKPYTIEPELPGEKPLHLDVDDNVFIPIYGIHRDPQYYPEPEKFDPERFSLENRKSIDPYTYLPFGVGPRNCIGSRFALLEIKAVFFYLLSHFEIVPVEQTNIPIKINKKALQLTSENGFPFGLKRRN